MYEVIYDVIDYDAVDDMEWITRGVKEVFSTLDDAVEYKAQLIQNVYCNNIEIYQQEY